MSEHTPPPLGVIPQWLDKERRLKDINAAIARYIEARIVYPLAWETERKEIINWLFEFNNFKELEKFKI